ncbi:MAG: helix-turn-helix domain-containing protein [Actinophytocola sp.]|nr:helix-turn-helix domain-containing protein [Actinophytocola sp.]
MSSYGDKCYCRHMATIRVTRPDDLGAALREARLAEGITQSALAQLVGVSRQWLSAFEMGAKSSAPLDMVMRIVAALDVSVTLSRPAPPAPADEEEPVDLDALLDGVDA